MVAVIISHLAPLPCSDGWWKRAGGSTQGLLCLFIWDIQPEQTQFLNRLPAGHLRSQLLNHTGEGKLELFEHLNMFQGVWFWPGRAESCSGWALTQLPPLPIACLSCCLGMVQVVLLLPKLLITNETALKRDTMKPFHFIRNSFIPIFLPRCCDKCWSSSRLSVGYSLGPSFQICFLLDFLVSCFVSMETPQPNSSYNAVRCINNAVIKEHPQLWMFAHHVSCQTLNMVSGEATWSPKLDGSLKALGELLKPAVAPLERSFLWLVFLKAVVPTAILFIGKEGYFPTFKRTRFGLCKSLSAKSILKRIDSQQQQKKLNRKDVSRKIRLTTSCTLEWRADFCHWVWKCVRQFLFAVMKKSGWLDQYFAFCLHPGICSWQYLPSFSPNLTVYFEEHQYKEKSLLLWRQKYLNNSFPFPLRNFTDAVILGTPFSKCHISRTKPSAQENLQPFKEEPLDCEIKCGSASLKIIYLHLYKNFSFGSQE